MTRRPNGSPMAAQWQPTGCRFNITGQFQHSFPLILLNIAGLQHLLELSNIYNSTQNSLPFPSVVMGLQFLLDSTSTSTSSTTMSKSSGLVLHQFELHQTLWINFTLDFGLLHTVHFTDTLLRLLHFFLIICICGHNSHEWIGPNLCGLFCTLHGHFEICS